MGMASPIHQLGSTLGQEPSKNSKVDWPSRASEQVHLLLSSLACNHDFGRLGSLHLKRQMGTINIFLYSNPEQTVTRVLSKDWVSAGELIRSVMAPSPLHSRL